MRILLYDELADEQQPTTSIEIQWPQKFSRGFEERGQLEKLLEEYLEIIN